MKYLKITVLEPANSPMVYPTNYQSEIGNFAVDHLYYDETPLDGKSELILLIKDDDFKPTMMRERAEEINEATAKSISEAHEVRTETIVDEAKVRRLELKSRLGMALTTEELNAIDPTKPESVFKTSPILADRVVDLKAKEVVKVGK